MNQEPFDGPDDDLSDAVGDPDPRVIPGLGEVEPIYTCQDLPTATANAWAAIARANDPPTLFRYGGNPVRLGTDDSERLVFETLATDKMRHEVSRAAPWRRRVKNKANVELSGEIARRCVLIDIDPAMDQPWLRDWKGFRHPDLIEWVDRNRGELVAAALTLIRGWVQDGMPKWKGQQLGSFPAWSQVMGGILERAGVPDFLGNMAELLDAADLEGAVTREFVSQWWDRYKGNTVGVKDLIEIATGIDGFDLGKGQTDRGIRTALGARLRKKPNNVVGRFKVSPVGLLHRASLWKLIPLREMDHTHGD